MKRKYWLFDLILVCNIIFYGCTRNDEVPYAINSSIQGKLQYTEAISGQVMNLPLGQFFNVFRGSTPAPYYRGTTTQTGYYSYIPPALSSYKLTFKHLDTILQFNSAIVRKVDIDTLRKNEYDTVGYIDAVDIALVKDQIVNEAVNLLPTITGMRITATDSNDNILPNVSLCVYNNLTFYNQNFPNCGGSLKYVITNSSGVALLTGLTPSTTYYINARASIGTYNISNHYSTDAQRFLTAGKGTINPQTVILK